jgi:hypothetical protein
LSRFIEIYDRKERFTAGSAKILEALPLVLKTTRAAFQVFEKHLRNGAHVRHHRESL